MLEFFVVAVGLHACLCLGFAVWGCDKGKEHFEPLKAGGPAGWHIELYVVVTEKEVKTENGVRTETEVKKVYPVPVTQRLSDHNFVYDSIYPMAEPGRFRISAKDPEIQPYDARSPQLVA